jgi:membrane protein
MAAGSLAVALDAHARIGAPLLAGQVALVLLTMGAFTGAYLVVPATRVRFWPALVGGVIAGGAFEIAKGVYSWAASHLFQFQALYGSLAAVFVFLLWLYLSWTLFLFGARLAFVLQHHRVLLDPSEASRTAIPRELLALRALVEVALAFRDGEPPPDAGVVADRLEAAAEPVREVLSALEDAGLVRAGERGGLVPARPAEQISLADVRAVFAGTAAIAVGAKDLAAILLAEAEGAAAARLAERSIHDLCGVLRPPRDGASGPRAAPPAPPTARIPV